ncbi:AAHS family benzoate transporter-like MFS transporter [Rhizobium sp. BK226]|uniref:MFS transporter n=1 Tax=Rhizobium TaxID=379 RepID=UPI000BE8C4E8|nr:MULTISPECIES: aromatic acid/H+ symport family MFS transporter [Rhizobium]MBB4116065.1 AAHS family benzoate transporter-like MFS transporter [Rhizobium sp. BK226]PDS61906.1 MFS transporter [Rhizobium anhuiense]
MSSQEMSAMVAQTKTTTSVIAMCGFMILFDGYDLVVYGVIAPALLKQAEWALDPSLVGRAAALTLFGMLLGAAIAGTLADRIGRKKVVLGSLASFSFMMIASGLAPNFPVFAATRFLSGLGLGALLPTVTALILEFSPAKRKALANSLSFMGYLLGGILSGILGMLLLEHYGWRPLMIIGGAPLLALPFLIKSLPESPDWLAAKGRRAEADAVCDSFSLERVPHQPTTSEKQGVRALFAEGRLALTLNAWAIHFCSLLLTFGMVNWLPTIMNKMGYDISSALLFAIMLNVGAAIGIVIAGRIADRGHVKMTVAVLFAIGAGAIYMLTLKQGVFMYALVALAGAGTIGTQILSNVLVGRFYPVQIRGTGLGFSLAVGRLGGMAGPLIGGAVLQRGLAPEWNFYIFAIAAVVGCALTALTFLHGTTEKGDVVVH